MGNKGISFPQYNILMNETLKCAVHLLAASEVMHN